MAGDNVFIDDTGIICPTYIRNSATNTAWSHAAWAKTFKGLGAYSVTDKHTWSKILNWLWLFYETKIERHPCKVKEKCPTPSCQAKLTIIDQWRVKKGKKDKKTPRFKYGHMMEVELPTGAKAWSVAIRLPKTQERGAFQVFNAHFFHVYQTDDEGLFRQLSNRHINQLSAYFPTFKLMKPSKLYFLFTKNYGTMTGSTNVLLLLLLIILWRTHRVSNRAFNPLFEKYF